ncbi:hypothetical protein [Parachitinimonas caeni]|uniref:Uncharacterized protein n=1 Tax=Parachitinimonas caeni TaxID=3031301 RepID=A0ABT7DYX6_9NEIS|nr:hypothetical protein [Parachitinimonas caeni]MDK2125246.1 hypothetical protein [Parachitinimonas caeni]
MIHISYFFGLAAAGTFFLSLTLGFVLEQCLDLLALLVGMTLPAEWLRPLIYLSIALIWIGSLAVLGWRRRGLSPPLRRAGQRDRLVVAGHILLLTGHALVAAMLIIDNIGLLLILPLIAVVSLYAAAVLLLELSRRQARRPSQADDPISP